MQRIFFVTLIKINLDQRFGITYDFYKDTCVYRRSIFTLYDVVIQNLVRKGHAQRPDMCTGGKGSCRDICANGVDPQPPGLGLISLFI